MKISLEEIKHWLVALLKHVKLSEEDASLVAENLISAESRGVYSHGLILIDLYVKRILQGGIKTHYEPTIKKAQNNLIVIDGDGGPGQALAHLAVDEAIKKAKHTGIAFVNLINSNHVGMLATYGSKIASQDLLGLIMTNSGPSVGVHNGKGKKLGNNALCFGVPSKGNPFIIDMATGIVACGKIRAANLKSKEIPSTWLSDMEGNPTTDPSILDKGGYVPVFGGHKGFCLSILIDITTAMLGGAVASPMVLSQRGNLALPTGASQAFLVIDPECLGGILQLKENTEKYFESLRQTQPQKADESIVLPEDKELENYKNALVNGINIPDYLLDKLNKTAASVKFEKL